LKSNQSLEARLQYIEDRLEIYNLISAHPPSADLGASEYTGSVWMEDGVFDRGDVLGKEVGRDAIANLVAIPEHRASINAGIAHVSGLPHVTITGDTASVTHYLLILVPQTQGDEVSVPNHGASKGFHVHRALASHWKLVRTADGWKFATRSVRLLDGSPDARALLQHVIDERSIISI
jgi:hypothetical protein